MIWVGRQGNGRMGMRRREKVRGNEIARSWRAVRSLAGEK
jgi:hypothetical protein